MPPRPTTRRRYQPTLAMIRVAGEWLLNHHLQKFDPPPTRQQFRNMLADHKLLAESTRQAFTDMPTAVFAPLSVVKQRSARTMERLALMDELVRRSPLQGVPAEEMLDYLASKTGHRIKCNSLDQTLVRNYPLHQMRFFRGHFCLRADMTVLALSRNLAAEKKARRAVQQIQLAPKRKVA